MRTSSRNPRRVTTMLTAGILLLALLIVGSFMRQTLAADTSTPADKIEPLLLENMAAEGQTDFFIWMTEKANLAGAANLMTKEERGTFVFNALRQTAETTQRDVRALLDRQGISYRPFYISNKIYVSGGNLDLINTLAARPDVIKITANHQYQLQEPIIEAGPPVGPAAVAANISFVNANDVWAIGYDG